MYFRQLIALYRTIFIIKQTPIPSENKLLCHGMCLFMLIQLFSLDEKKRTEEGVRMIIMKRRNPARKRKENIKGKGL